MLMNTLNMIFVIQICSLASLKISKKKCRNLMSILSNSFHRLTVLRIFPPVKLLGQKLDSMLRNLKVF